MEYTTVRNKEKEIKREVKFLQEKGDLIWDDKLILLLDLAILDGIKTLKRLLRSYEA